jgi:hypothetical protein
MVANSFETLKKVIEDSSVAADFYRAVDEWTVTAVEEDPIGQGECVCGQQHLVYMYTIGNQKNGRKLEFIGSKCVQHFQNSGLNLQVTVFRGLFELRKKILAGDRITLTSEYFSRGILQWLYEEGAFPANEHNDGDPHRDYTFLLDMFNKRNKDDVSPARRRKINGMLYYTVNPFVRDHPALG